jgi:pyridoxal phosphate enzyme (YggS family)
MMKDLVTTICASKYFDTHQMRQLYQKGVVHFGENQAQNLLKKIDALSDLNIQWHFIGHLQTNKVKDIIHHIDMLHTLDRIRLADEIQKHAKRPVDCFIQVNLTDEPQKSGINPDNLHDFLIEIKNYDKINIVGLMTMGKDQDDIITESAFKKLNELALIYQLPYRSMGMTEDYQLAVKHHTTHLRIGRKFFEMLD